MGTPGVWADQTSESRFFLYFSTSHCLIDAPSRVVSTPGAEEKEEPLTRFLQVSVPDDQPADPVVHDFGLVSDGLGWLNAHVRVQRVHGLLPSDCSNSTVIPGRTIILRDPYAGVWHFFHNILFRSFSSMATLPTPLVTCGSDLPSVCEFDPSVRILVMGDKMNKDGAVMPSFHGLLDHMTAFPVLHTLDPGTCFESVLFGSLPTLDLNFGLVTPRLVVVLAHFQRWYAYITRLNAHQPHEPPVVAPDLLPILFGDSAPLSDSVDPAYVRPIPDAPSVVLLGRRGYRPVGQGFLTNASRWLGDMGIPPSHVRVVYFDAVAPQDVPSVFANATLVISPTGAQLINLHSLLPGTVIIDWSALKYFGLATGTRTTRDFYIAIANARNCPVIRWTDLVVDVVGFEVHQVPQFLPYRVFSHLVSAALQLGVHAYMPPTWHLPDLNTDLDHPVDYAVHLPPDDFSAYLSLSHLSYSHFP